MPSDLRTCCPHSSRPKSTMGSHVVSEVYCVKSCICCVSSLS